MSYERITRHNSPNFTPRSKVASVFGIPRNITGITIHHWGDPRSSPSFDGVISWLCRKNGNTSAHAVIESGRVAYIVDYINASWHAGNGRANATTIGLELNPRASTGDYETAGEHIADIWVTYGPLPLYAHKYWKATLCPGKWDLTRLKEVANRYYQQKMATSKPVPKPVVKAAYHVVKKGDTLFKIANKNKTTVGQLLRLNTIKDKDKIYPGQRIRVQ